VCQSRGTIESDRLRETGSSKLDELGVVLPCLVLCCVVLCVRRRRSGGALPRPLHHGNGEVGYIGVMHRCGAALFSACMHLHACARVYKLPIIGVGAMDVCMYVLQLFVNLCKSIPQPHSCVPGPIIHGRPWISCCCPSPYIIIYTRDP
jgi:hypothetical protein